MDHWKGERKIRAMGETDGMGPVKKPKVENVGNDEAEASSDEDRRENDTRDDEDDESDVENDKDDESGSDMGKEKDDEPANEVEDGESDDDTEEDKRDDERVNRVEDDKSDDDDQDEEDGSDVSEEYVEKESASSSSSASSEEDDGTVNDDKTINAFEELGLVTPKPGLTATDIVNHVTALAVKMEGPLKWTMTQLRLFRLFFKILELPTTEKSFWESISHEDDPKVQRHMYCRKCHALIGVGTMPNADCACGASGPGKPEHEASYFIKVDIKTQLQKILSIPKMGEHLTYRYNRQKNSTDGIEDIYDGMEYKKLSEPGHFLSSRWNYSFTLSVDCLKMKRSSEIKAWPVLLTINELPPQLRKRHMILAGIWLDSKPPSFNTYLVPILDELWLLYTTGLTWKPDNINVLKSKFTTVMCLVDSKTRSDLLNMNEFDDEYGCSNCCTKGTKIPQAGRVYPVKKAARRTDGGIRKRMIRATETGGNVMGVKGKSIATILTEFNLERGMVVDSMEIVFLGVAKELTRLLINGEPTDPWYRGDRRSLKKINSVVLDLEPPPTIGNSPARIESNTSWDATDWKHWLLYYSVPSLFKIVRPTDHKLLVMLSEAAHLLSGDKLTPRNLKAARTSLDKFLQGFESAFGQAKMTFNFHLLGHLCDTVESWGPLWVHSAYPFKSHNKLAINIVKSRKADPIQLSKGYFLVRYVETIASNDTVASKAKTEILTILNNQSEGSPEFYIRNNDFCDFHGIGAAKRGPPRKWEIRVLKEWDLRCAGKLTMYKKALIKGIEFQREDYVPKMDETLGEEEDLSPTLLFTRDMILVEIQNIVSFIDADGNTVSGVFGKIMRNTGNLFNAKHIWRVQATENRTFIQIEDVLGPAISFHAHGSRHVARLAIPWK